MGCNCGGTKRMTSAPARPVSVQSYSSGPTVPSPTPVQSVSIGYPQQMNPNGIIQATPVKRTTV